VREDPHVPELVRHRCIEFLCTQPREEAVFDRESERRIAIHRCFDGDNERDPRLNRDVHALSYAKSIAQSIDDDLNSIGDDGVRIGSGSGRSEARHDEEDESPCRGENDPWEYTSSTRSWRQIGPCFHEELSGNGDQDITCDDHQVKSCNLFHKRHLRGVTDRNVPGISYAPTHELGPN
jgi:hypothetical protein